jgi:hypothetical protein
MITNTGKNIIAKYLIGQAPAYASYIAVGCGAAPTPTDGVFDDYSNKTELDFEMFRSPIVSRGYVTEDGISKIVLTAELPTEERYEISEVGVYSAGSNPSAVANDSRLLYAFTQTENWEYHSESAVSSIPIIYEPLDGGAQDNVIKSTDNVFQTNVDNRIFTEPTRAQRYERCRFLNNIIMIAGNDADLIIDEESENFKLNPETFSNHLHLTGIDLDLNKNSPLDELRVSFSIVNKFGFLEENPEKVRMLIEFASTDIFDEGQYARLEIEATDLDYDFENNRYVVISKKLEELVTSSGFTWNSVDVVKIYASVIVDDEPSGNYYIALDALRLENLTVSNPLYGLTGYSVIKNTNAETIIKASNTTNLIEFRFAIDILDVGGES